MRHTLRRCAVAAAAFAVSVGFVAPSAEADPGFVPDSDDIVGVGSDTTEFVMNKLASAYNNSGQAGFKRLASFNATGSATIVPRAGADPITRPNGSSAGIDELQANPDISFARSSRGPRTSGDEGTVFFPYAKDRLGYVFAATTNAKKTLGAPALKSIYTCQ